MLTYSRYKLHNCFASFECTFHCMYISSCLYVFLSCYTFTPYSNTGTFQKCTWSRGAVIFVVLIGSEVCIIAITLLVCKGDWVLQLQLRLFVYIGNGNFTVSFYFYYIFLCPHLQDHIAVAIPSYHSTVIKRSWFLSRFGVEFRWTDICKINV